MWRWNEEMCVWEEVRFYFFCVAAFFGWVGDGFEPEFVGERGGGSKRISRIGGGWMKGRIGRSGPGIGAALRGVLVFGFGQDIYDLELWWRMWPYNEPPLKEQYKRECALLLFSLSLLFRREVVCWAATDCPDVEGEILI